MAQAEIGALRVRLAMDAGEFHKGLKDAESGLSGLANRLGVTAKNAAIAGAAIGAAIAAAGAAITFAIKGVIDKADELGKAAQKIGIPVEALSQLKHAADLSGISMETLSNGVKKLSVNMEEIAGGGTTSGAARSLAALGISATRRLRPAQGRGDGDAAARRSLPRHGGRRRQDRAGGGDLRQVRRRADPAAQCRRRRH